MFSLILITSGLLLAVRGAKLMLLGGSYYYALAGAAQVVAGALFLRRNPWGERLYTAVVCGTLAWALFEVGFAPWGLIVRLWFPTILALWLLTPWARRSLAGQVGKISPAGITGLVCCALIVMAFLLPQWTPSETTLPPPIDSGSLDGNDWPHYGSTLQGDRFSPLTQINPKNVNRLEVAWMFRSGDRPTAFSSAEATPLKVGDTIYTCTPNSVVIALDAQSGAERWRFDPQNADAPYPIRTCRGVAYYHSPEDSGECTATILSTTLDSRLVALNAANGRLCSRFGHAGMVSLRENMGETLPYVSFTTSTVSVIRGHVVLGGLVFDNQSTDMPSGVIRSYDATTGQLQWAWDMGVPDRVGPPADGQIYTRSTPNSWTIFAADEQLGLVYVPMGNASPDFWGAKRRPFDEKYGSSIVALDLESGRPRWSFQTVHHDLWDYDVPAQPSLVELPTPQGYRSALVQPTKRGDIYVLDRRTGEPIVPVAERAVPQGAARADWVSKTQPFSQLRLPAPRLSESAMWGVTPFDQLECRIQFRLSRYDGMFTPPGLDPTIIMPGLTGAVNWGGVSIDIERKVLVANYMMLPWRGNLVPREQMTAAEAASPWTQRMTGTPYIWHQSPWLGPFQVPCSEPPWGRLVAIDLVTHAVLWSEPLGTGRDSGPFNIPSGLGFTMGVPSMGGTVVTRSGLVFISGTLDRYVRAFDLQTGKEVWRARLPAGGQATPMTYMAGGRQFLVVTAGGHSLMGTKPGDYTIAYALPR